MRLSCGCFATFGRLLVGLTTAAEAYVVGSARRGAIFSINPVALTRRTTVPHRNERDLARRLAAQPWEVSEADAIVRHLTKDEWRIVQEGAKLLLCHDGTSSGITILPYQLTRLGILKALVELLDE